MELKIDIDRPVVEWLASMGYPVAGMPSELLHGMLLREARQWQLSPEALCALIDAGASYRGAIEWTAPSRRDVLWHRMHDRSSQASI